MAEPISKKMYSKSPRIVADENGKKKVEKGFTEAEKKSSEVNSGTDGLTEVGDYPNGIAAIHERHTSEYKDMVKRHMKEIESANPLAKADAE